VLALLALLLLVAHPRPVPPRPLAGEAPAMPAQCGEDGARCREQLIFSSGRRLSVYRNVPMSGSRAVTRALVVVHGTGRNPVSTFTGMMRAATEAGVLAHTLVLAPFFKTSEDSPSDRDATWTSGGWKVGDGAVEPSGLSSFAAMDEIVTSLADRSRFPNLTHITVVGHSAGGQFTQRYAAFGLAPGVVRGVGVNFVVANPSSYVYLDPARPEPDGGGFRTPSGGACPDYDTYKYGLAGRGGYPGRLTPEQARATYLSRRVTILNGGADTVQNGDMDTDCGAMLQGPNRAARGANFYRRIHGLYPNAPHDRIVVPGVDHDHYALFESPLALGALFGHGAASATASGIP
jgi:pimeloyl-ACP methyl ester carboxylesterase